MPRSARRSSIYTAYVVRVHLWFYRANGKHRTMGTGARIDGTSNFLSPFTEFHATPCVPASLPVLSNHSGRSVVFLGRTCYRKISTRPRPCVFTPCSSREREARRKDENILTRRAPLTPKRDSSSRRDRNVATQNVLDTCDSSVSSNRVRPSSSG